MMTVVPVSCKVCDRRKKYNRLCRRNDIARGSPNCKMVLGRKYKELWKLGVR